MEVRLDGKIAIITGGSMGMGKAMAHKFAASGAEVAIVARRPEPLADTAREIIGRRWALPSLCRGCQQGR